MTTQGEKLSHYGFIVDRRANNVEIKKSVEEMFGVKVSDVNTINYHGKRKSRLTKAGVLKGRTNHFKKAIVTLTGKDTIDFFSNI
jgi:large subunit ribosomal protein L23